MKISDGRDGRIGWAMAGRKSPWGSAGGPDGGADDAAGGEGRPVAGGADDGSADPTPSGDGPRNPWLPPSGEGNGPRRSASIEDIFRSRSGRGGGGGGGGGGPFGRLPLLPDGRSWAPWIVLGVLGLWLLATAVHRVGPQERGVVATFGRYSRELAPGTSLTLPWPFQTVTVRDVTTIQRDSIPEGEGERLMLTSDQNLVDLSYLVRWNIKDLKQYLYQIADPEKTVKEVAEAAMRQSIAEVTLNDAMGAGRAQIEQSARQRMQAVLDAYHAGITIQGVEIKKTDPPAKVVDAFKEVLAAQQDAQSSVNRAEALAQQLTARAQGDAAAFDKVYGQYKLAPEVTKRRMYYETMERVLSKNNKVIIEAPGTVPYLSIPGQLLQAPQAAPSAGAGGN